MLYFQFVIGWFPAQFKPGERRKDQGILPTICATTGNGRPPAQGPSGAC
jgi:hypothetical protein